ncbi:MULTISPECIES: molybdopterin-guanine dinucleotide biosynthesis protein B [unclassified Caballeronia]|uniref:molybdopterin-guanine dinucleotide biosynthesis protein B n=1 Tax=unclassified Caballeronia TaxID=2646786 RepID=UPI002855EE68|nr:MULTISPECIES: molybdopterin-guanine dinucleotide biosynthesis protein B [unclassified Caballeronia]MDR5754114.1 molybdopterin-guanine dinucleotide biosynthesis protein B [Caballeronia sp. LZ024]MDR5840492.1 molybdopterin-guanine dinucleotide biosynthesis protein B [Caballeronia sp. LZ031]
MISAKPPLFGISGRSGQGKTTLIEALLPWLRARGLVVNVIKHSHHSIELEPAHKDSARFRHAGAGEVLIASPYRYAIVRELRDEPEPSLDELAARLAPADLTIVEGYTRESLPRLEVVRAELATEPLYKTDAAILAIASDEPGALATTLPVLPLNDIDRIGEFICKTVHINFKTPRTRDN